MQLGTMPGLTCKSMFGGEGIWKNGIFFAILFEDRLFFRAGPETIGQYLDAGMKPFEFHDCVSKNYFEVPSEIQASGSKLTAWAEAAIQEATRAKKPKAKTKPSPKRKSNGRK